MPSLPELVVPAPATVTIPIDGSAARFPVHRVYCVGRNYAAHVIEMGGDPNREAPFFFQKNPGNLVSDGGDFPYPPKSANVHHEVELVVALGSGGADVPVSAALDLVFGYAVGLDMTRRDLQDACKAAGRPWEIAKAFEHSAPIGPLVPASRIGHPAAGAISLSVNGAMRQHGDLGQMIWKVPEMIAYVSGLFALSAGDLIFSGTPSGVGPIVRGDRMAAAIAGVGRLDVAVT